MSDNAESKTAPFGIHKAFCVVGSIACLLVVAIVVGVPLGLCLSAPMNDGAADDEGNSPSSLAASTMSPSNVVSSSPSVVPSTTPSLQPTPVRLSTEQVNATVQSIRVDLIAQYNVSGLSTDGLHNGSAQALALESMAANVVELDGWSELERVQRFALSVFYFSTNAVPNDFFPSPDPWTSAELWLSNRSECEWEGVRCENGMVTEIVLPSHGLCGGLPEELALLSESLRVFDVSGNFIYINGEALQTPLDSLANLQVLDLQDNYLVNLAGLPPSWSSLTSLQKLDASYNILQGPLSDSLFAAWPKLSHLELEGNYLSSTLPVSLLQSTALEYLYMRRNNLELDLAQVLAPGTLPSIVSLWLDANVIVGPIPKSIVTKPKLASLSLANATLRGSIPSEMGRLSDMRRVWLYDSQLTGTIPIELSNWTQLEVFEVYDNALLGPMPPAVCEAVANSTYDLKALTADCDQVLCDNCCTSCL